MQQNRANEGKNTPLNCYFSSSTKFDTHLKSNESHVATELELQFCHLLFSFKGIEVARRIRDEERGGKAKLVIIGKINVL